MPYYAVAKGHTPGVYSVWTDAKAQIDRFKYPVFRKFDTTLEAHSFMSQHQHTQQTIGSFFEVETSDPKESDQILIAFTDGSSINNGKTSSKSGYAVLWPYHQDLNYATSILHGTNNIAEISALIKAIELADSNLDPGFTKTLVVYTDSMLLVNTITKWMSTWKKKDWRKSDGNIIANLDLIKRLDELLKTRKISVKHVRAHTGNQTWEAKWNNEVDILARKAAMRQI